MKPFPWKCGTCRERGLAPVTIPYSTEIQHDGRIYAVSIPALDVLLCGNCGAIMLNDEADDKISDALRQAAGLMSPEEIRRNREALGMTQKQLATLLDAGEATLSRWESGGQIQQRAMNKLLWLVFESPEARRLLGREEPTSLSGLPVAAVPAGASSELTGS